VKDSIYLDKYRLYTIFQQLTETFGPFQGLRSFTMRITCKLLLLSILLLILSPTHILSVQQEPRVIHAFVALCDNENQGIIPVPEFLGNGDDPGNNLYWGAMYGVKSFFKRSQNWILVETIQCSKPILERCIFKHKNADVYFVADAYQGIEIKQAVIDFLNAASGKFKETVSVNINAQGIDLKIHGNSNLIVYVGHDGLMDFSLEGYPEKHDDKLRETIILACISKTYFAEAISISGAKPLLWTTGLMAPEAYTLEGAFEGWILRESDETIRMRAAEAYSKYQKECTLKGARGLLVTGK
jgi:hypothetical protein